MKKGLVVLSTASVVAGACAFAAAMTPAIAATNTNITATVGKIIECEGMQDATVASEITPGNAGTATLKIGAKTNSVSGFTVTAGTMPSLASGANTIALNPSAAAGVQGWKGVVTTTAEWTKLGDGSTLADNAVWTNAGYSDTEDVAITVGTTTETPSGTYTGTIAWTCAAK